MPNVTPPVMPNVTPGYAKRYTPPRFGEEREKGRPGRYSITITSASYPGPFLFLRRLADFTGPSMIQFFTTVTA